MYTFALPGQYDNVREIMDDGFGDALRMPHLIELAIDNAAHCNTHEPAFGKDSELSHQLLGGWGRQAHPF